MKISRNVAFEAAKDETGLAPDEAPGLGKVPLWGSLKSGWIFFFTQIGRIATHVWLAAIVLAVLEAKLSVDVGAHPSAATIDGLVWFSLTYVLLYTFVAASLYALALGSTQRFTLAGFSVGPDQLRFLTVSIVYGLIVFMLLLGAYLVGFQLAKYLSISGDIAHLSTPSRNDIRWFQELPRLEQVALTSPFALALPILVWFSMRWSFVPLHVIAVRKLAIFDALALTKGNTWRLLGLTLLLVVMLEAVGWGVVYLLGLVEGTIVSAASDVVSSVRSTVGGSHHTQLRAPHPASVPHWISPFVRTLLNLLALSVTAGTFTHAYNKVTGR